MNNDFITKENHDRVQSIINTKGKNAKISLLKQYKVFPEFVEMMQYCYDPFTPYKIKKIGAKHMSMADSNPTESIKEFLDMMAKKDSANDQNIATAAFILHELNDVDLALLFKRVLNKDLKLGCNVRSLNEAGYDIPTFDIQLAHAQSHLTKFYAENKDGFIIQTKYDGNRAVCKINDKGVAKFFSRNGHTIESCDFLLSEIMNMGFPPNTTLDGEILHHTLNLQALQSIVSKKDSSHGKGHELTYQVFDRLEWDGEDLMNDRLESRMNVLHSDMHTIGQSKYVVPAPYSFWLPHHGEAEACVQSAFQVALDEGHEGLILKSPSSVYEGKRSRNWVKIKERDNLDVEILEIVEGEGRFEGMLGAVVCELNGHKFNVGTGWKESERIVYWKNPNEILGKTLEMSYWKLSPDGVPLHPAKVQVRTDK